MTAPMLKMSEAMKRRLTAFCKVVSFIGMDSWAIADATALKNVAMVDIFRRLSRLYSWLAWTAELPISTKSLRA